MRGYPLVILGLGLILSSAPPAAAQSANGTIVYQSKSGPITMEVKHAFLVKGPDAVSGNIVRNLILSVADIGPALRKCKQMVYCFGGLREGITLTFDAMPMVPVWFVANDQRLQHSALVDYATLALTIDTPARLAGRWELPANRTDGLALKVQFDAVLTNVLAK